MYQSISSFMDCVSKNLIRNIWYTPQMKSHKIFLQEKALSKKYANIYQDTT